MHEHQGERSHQQSPFVINLCSSMRPIDQTPDLSELGNYRLYQSHRKEDGRERHRLHLGLFVSNADAMRVVSLVRRDFPAALVVRATEDDLRHFDYVPPMPSIPEKKAQPAPEISMHEAEEIVLATEPTPEREAAPDLDGAEEARANSPEEVNWDMAGIKNKEVPVEEEPVTASESLKDYYGLSDTARVRHLSVELKPPSLTTRLFNKFKRKKRKRKR